jgi:hypothetical protein
MPNMLLPSPIVYSSMNDCIILQQKSMEIASYLQNNLVMLSNERVWVEKLSIAINI